MRAKGRTDILVGAGIFLLGALITVGTYVAAAKGGGGRYTIASGALVWGLIMVLRGLDRERTGVERAFWGKRG